MVIPIVVLISTCKRFYVAIMPGFDEISGKFAVHCVFPDNTSPVSVNHTLIIFSFQEQLEFYIAN